MPEKIPTVILDKAEHRGEPVLCIKTDHFPLSQLARYELKATWSQTRQMWYMDFSRQNVSRVVLFFAPYAIIDKSAVEEKLTRERHNLENISLTETDIVTLGRFKRWLQTKRYSASTVETYTGLVTFFIKYINKRHFGELTARTVARFNYEFIVQAEKSISYQNQVINALKQYFLYTGLEVEIEDIERPKMAKRLPVVLSAQEVRRIIDCATNLKHKTLLSLIYSGGFRISEVLNLKPADIDSERMLIHVKNAKGNKDRYTLLSQKALVLLREYYLVYKPQKYLFEGQNGQQYSDRAAQQVLKIVAARAGILKRITLHSLRHSFATHLLENGTDIRYIQNLLGHSSPKTTMIYTHVSQASVQNIRNPLDMI
jgi:integrase/recombinase XerD